MGDFFVKFNITLKVRFDVDLENDDEETFEPRDQEKEIIAGITHKLSTMSNDEWSEFLDKKDAFWVYSDKKGDSTSFELLGDADFDLVKVNSAEIKRFGR